jgi:hypothetical protein
MKPSTKPGQNQFASVWVARLNVRYQEENSRSWCAAIGGAVLPTHGKRSRLRTIYPNSYGGTEFEQLTLDEVFAF